MKFSSWLSSTLTVAVVLATIVRAHFLTGFMPYGMGVAYGSKDMFYGGGMYPYAGYRRLGYGGYGGYGYRRPGSVYNYDLQSMYPPHIYHAYRIWY